MFKKEGGKGRLRKVEQMSGERKGKVDEGWGETEKRK